MRKKLIYIHNKRRYEDFTLDFRGDTIDILPVSGTVYNNDVKNYTNLNLTMNQLEQWGECHEENTCSLKW